MSDVSGTLHKLVEEWRASAQAIRIVSNEIPHLMARGHMYGLADGLELAANDVERILTLLDRPAPVYQ